MKNWHVAVKLVSVCTVAAKKIARHKKLDEVLSIAIATLLKVVFVDR